MCSKQRSELQTAADNASPDASPPRPGSTDSQAHQLRRHWLECAFASAGIDPSHWDPARGVDANRRTIERVYNYYGRLYEQHARLQWAGIANFTSAGSAGAPVACSSRCATNDDSAWISLTPLLTAILIESVVEATNTHGTFIRRAPRASLRTTGTPSATTR